MAFRRRASAALKKFTPRRRRKIFHSTSPPLKTPALISRTYTQAVVKFLGRFDHLVPKWKTRVAPVMIKHLVLSQSWANKSISSEIVIYNESYFTAGSTRSVTFNVEIANWNYDYSKTQSDIAWSRLRQYYQISFSIFQRE